MFTGLTVANILGVPFGTWLGQAYGWRSTFWAVTLVGLVALAVIALLVPSDEKADAAEEAPASVLAVLGPPQVLLGLLTTVLAWVGVFAVFTYIAPILTSITGFSEAAVSPILLVFGGGLVVGNLLGGRLADRRLVPTVLGTLLALVRRALRHDLRHPQPGRWRSISIGLFGAAAFATVAPLQMWVLEKADGAGQGLASSLQHRRLQPRQRHRRLARRRRHRPWAGPRRHHLGRRAGAARGHRRGAGRAARSTGATIARRGRRLPRGGRMTVVRINLVKGGTPSWNIDVSAHPA